MVEQEHRVSISAHTASPQFPSDAPGPSPPPPHGPLISPNPATSLASALTQNQEEPRAVGTHGDSSGGDRREEELVCKLDVLACDCNPSILDVEAGGLLGV